METENFYLYVYYNMPPLANWDPRDAVNLWMSDKNRRKRKCPEATEQKWFKGIFEQKDEDSKECPAPKKIVNFNCSLAKFD